VLWPVECPVLCPLLWPVECPVECPVLWPRLFELGLGDAAAVSGRPALNVVLTLELMMELEVAFAVQLPLIVPFAKWTPVGQVALPRAPLLWEVDWDFDDDKDEEDAARGT
jgi:hypothetical protein